MKNKFVFGGLLILATAFYFSFGFGMTADAALTLPTRTITKYRPVVGSGTKTMQGGLPSSKPGPDGQAIVRTVDDFLSGRSTYVTGAADTKSNGATYTAKIRYKDTNGNMQTRDVPVVVHDTGSFFRTDLARPLSNERLTAKNPNGTWKYPLEVPVELRTKFPNGMTKEENAAIRSSKLDIAVSTSKSDSDARKITGQNFSSIEIVGVTAENEKAKAADARTTSLITSAGAKQSEPAQTQTPCSQIVDLKERQGCLDNLTQQQQKPAEQTQQTEQTQTARQTKTSSGGSSSSSSGGMLWNGTDRLCHKHTGPATASQLKMAMTCNAGFLATNYVCGPHGELCCLSTYMKDCGPLGKLCNTASPLPVSGACAGFTTDGPQAGCLNYKCRLKPNAIWDMGSKKCGCG